MLHIFRIIFCSVEIKKIQEGKGMVSCSGNLSHKWHSAGSLETFYVLRCRPFVLQTTRGFGSMNSIKKDRKVSKIFWRVWQQDRSFHQMRALMSRKDLIPLRRGSKLPVRSCELCYAASSELYWLSKALLFVRIRCDLEVAIWWRLQYFMSWGS